MGLKGTVDNIWIYVVTCGSSELVLILSILFNRISFSFNLLLFTVEITSRNVLTQPNTGSHGISDIIWSLYKLNDNVWPTLLTHIKSKTVQFFPQKIWRKKCFFIIMMSQICIIFLWINKILFTINRIREYASFVLKL